MSETAAQPGSAGGREPRAEYQHRLEQRQQAVLRAEQRDLTISRWRGIVFAAAIALAVLAFYFQLVSALWLGVPAAAFIVLIVVHDRVIERKKRLAQAVAYYELGLARIDNRWQGRGVQDCSFVDEQHPYAADLDLFGEGSLFELLCTARTRAGEEALARWISEGASAEQSRARQQAVRDLGPRLDLREDLALLGGGVRAQLKPQLLIDWATAKGAFGDSSRTGLRVLAWGMALAAVVAGVMWAYTSLGPLPLIAVALVEWAITASLKKRLQPVVETVDRASRELEVLVDLLKRLEAESFSAPLLHQLQHNLTAEGQRAAAAIRRLKRLVSWLEARRNQFFAPFAFLLMWALHFALAIEAWRLHSGRHIPRWLGALGELEALSAVANYAYEHPDDHFPELVEGETLYVAEALGHPLLADADCVRNDVQLGNGCSAWLVSGSNMSGKSTLLRTVGVNAVLATAGAPVRATTLRMSPLCIGATIQLQDSLMAGASRFYAEISRLKQLSDLAEQSPPLLFLIDEILHGTNSHDRQVGATALIREFVRQGAIGLVTTHDLAIADTVEQDAGQLCNMHFEDRVEDDKLVFDYKIQPGVVQTRNALKWMRAVGLKV